MIGYIVLGLIVGFILGAIFHQRVVKEDLLIAEKVKVLVGKKVAEAKAELAKVVPEVKAEEKK